MIKLKKMRWAGYVGRRGKSLMHYVILAGTPEGKKPLERVRRRWKHNIKMKSGEHGDVCYALICQDRIHRKAVVNTAMNLRIPQNTGKFLSSCTSGGLSRRAQLHGVGYGKEDGAMEQK
jgi:hypothetical protein